MTIAEALFFGRRNDKAHRMSNPKTAGCCCRRFTARSCRAALDELWRLWDGRRRATALQTQMLELENCNKKTCVLPFFRPFFRCRKKQSG